MDANHYMTVRGLGIDLVESQAQIGGNFDPRKPMKTEEIGSTKVLRNQPSNMSKNHKIRTTTVRPFHGQIPRPLVYKLLRI